MSFPPPTRFDPFIQAVARQAEGIYTKMAIRRDESQDLSRRRKGGHDSDIQSIPWEDTTDVSVIALQGFLEDLLGLSHSHQDNMSVVTQSSSQEGGHPSATRSAALHAANAYRTTGMAVHDENVEMLQPAPVIPSSVGETPADDNTVRLGDDFGAEELATMRGYLKDLGELERRGVKFLTLRRSLTFLESIDQAIKSVL